MTSTLSIIEDTTTLYQNTTKTIENKSTSSELLYRIGLTKIPNIGAKNAKLLVSYCGGVEAVYKTSAKALRKIPGIGEKIARSIIHQTVLKEAERELAFVEKNKIQSLFYLDKNYPSRLKHYEDCPVLLYYKGNAELNAARVISIVGTRKPTNRGKAFCEEFVTGLKEYNVLVISGLAYGIDITAHKKCVELGIPTLAALGHGLDIIYPASHRSTAVEMVKNGGLITEFTSGIPPDFRNFPMRNRIIAGMCDALVVVETAKKGGSIITANFANDYNKDVFAVPGRVKDKYSQGCNHLIKIHKAALLESVDDIAYIMRWEAEKEKEKGIQRNLFVELSPTERQIVTLLQAAESIDMDTIAFKTQLIASDLAAHLLELELKGVIKSLPGKRYMLL